MEDDLFNHGLFEPSGMIKDFDYYESKDDSLFGDDTVTLP